MLTAFPSPLELKGAVQGTAIYLSLYFFAFVPFQALSKFALFERRKEKAKKDGKQISFNDVKYYNREDMLALCGDRTVGNYLEMGFLFLPLLWIHALFVDPGQSLTIAIVYTLSRALYPFVFWKSSLPFLLCSTVPGYVVYSYLLGSIVKATLV